jgi:TolA-binding protein
LLSKHGHPLEQRRSPANAVSTRLLAGIAAILIAGGASVWAQAPAPAKPAASAAPDASAAPASDNLNAVLAEAMAAFQSEDFAKAITGLKTVVTNADAPPAAMEPIYSTLAAAYFNAKDYPNAIASFTLYLQKYPQSTRANDILFYLAQAKQLSGDTAGATAVYKNLESAPGFREQALLARANAAKVAGQVDEAIAAFKTLISPDIASKIAARGAIQLVSLYVQKGENDKAGALLGLLQRRIGYVENVVGLNSLAVELGDKFLAAKAYPAALACYRTVRMKEDVIRIQNERIAGMEKQIEANLAAIQANPTSVLQIRPKNEQIRGEVDVAKKLLAEFEKLPSIVGALYMRMARCYAEDKKTWESIVVYEELLQRFGDAPEREPTLFALVVSYAQVNQAKLAQAKCDEYLSAFPTGPNAPEVGYLRGAMALQLEDYTGAETWFCKMLKENPKGKLSEQILTLLGNAKFSQGKFDEAVVQYRKYQQDFPQGENIEEADYRIAMASLFGGKFEEAFTALSNYVKKYAHGAFVPDAKYRMAVCKYAAQEYDEVIATCLEWEKDYSGSDQTGEVSALLGDAYAANDKPDEAIAAYTVSYKKAVTDEVLNYSIMEASKLLQKRNEWEKVAAMFQEFVKEKPTHPTAITALFWISKAKAKLGQVEEAKQFLAETIKKYIDDPTQQAVEQMLSQLAQLCVRKKRAEPAPEAAGSPGGASTPAPTPKPAPEVDPGTELDALLNVTANTGTAKARLLFAKAELARMRRQPAEQDKNYQAIADSTKPEELSPAILGAVGDYLLSKGDLNKATKFFTELMEVYPKSDTIDFAYNGLGEIAMRKPDFAGALKYYTIGTDKIAASAKLKDVTLGKGRALLALNKLDEAKKIFEQVGSVRDWHGEATAISVYSLGEIEFKKTKWAEANAFFQRVFVTYKKFSAWAAKAYIKSGECFEKLGKRQEAVNTYNELLRDEKLAKLPEAQLARARLKELGAG